MSDPDGRYNLPQLHLFVPEQRLTYAILFAAHAHDGQERRPPDDGPYIRHPLRVMLAVPAKAQVVAVLHDVIEDTGQWPPEGFLTRDEKMALELLSRTDDAESYSEYVATIAIAPGEAGEIARAVKLADLHDNMHFTTHPKAKARYRAAIRALSPS